VATLILQPDHDAPAGLLGDWLDELATVHLHAGERPPDPAGFARVVLLGSEHAADDDDVPWQAAVQEALGAADAAAVPVLGVCFGAQALARALGGGVRRAAHPELGEWIHAGTRAPAEIPDGPWLAWHKDELLPPPGAEVLAANDSGVQAYRAGRHAGVQFHPEVTPEIVAAWGGAPALVEETARRMDEVRPRAAALFAALLQP
jgi:GMP synthase (glutamine-hydrolysing)